MGSSGLVLSLLAAMLVPCLSNQATAQPTGQFVYVQKLRDAIEGGTNGNYKIGLHYPVPLAADVVVSYSFLGSQQAIPATDFDHIPAFTGSIVIPAGATEVFIQVDASNDGIIEGPESTGIQLTSAMSAGSALPIDPLNTSAQVKIIDANSASSTPIQVITGRNASEPSSAATFILKLAGVATSAWPVHVGYSLSGTTSPGVDFQSLGEIVIPANTNNISVAINMIDDHIIEGPESLNFAILSGSATDGGGNSFIFPPDPANNDINVDIADDDYTPANTLMTLTKISDAAEPATAGAIRMRLPADYVSSGSTTANIQFDGTASLVDGDYTPSATILPAYHNFADISLTVLDDTLTEGTETALCTLVGALDTHSLTYTGDPAQNVASVDIVDDEAILPLRLVSFTGRVSEDNAVVLKWVTAEEENTSHFEVLKSSDGRAFQQLGTVSASGSGNHDYTFTDTDPGLSNYYRLRMIDRATGSQDGAFTYSRMISVATDHAKAITVFPNPANNVLTIDFSGWKILPGKATVFDIYGKPQKQVPVERNRTHIQLNGFSSGVYFLSVGNGEAIKFIIQ